MDLVRSSAKRLALRVTLLQGTLLMTWTMYALFLPALAQRSGISAQFVIWILIADQLIFMVCDWMAGVYADYLAVVTRKVGPLINIAAAVSAVLLAAMPTIAEFGEPILWLVTVSIWAASSSFLRAPAFSMLGRIGGVSRKSGVVSWSLVGVCLAGALGPLLTTSLAKADPALPLLAAAVTLAAAAWLASRAEPRRSGETLEPRPEPAGSPWASVLLGLSVLCAAFGTQIHTLVVPLKDIGLSVPAATYWSIVFWTGFAGGLLAGARLAGQKHMHPWGALVMFVGAIALYTVPHAASAAAFAPLQFAAGATWAVVFTITLTLALSHGGRGGWASPVGLVFSAIAAAAVVRLTLTALKVDWSAWATPLAALNWLACAGLLMFHPWIRGAQKADP